jgi:hypothetical protein
MRPVAAPRALRLPNVAPQIIKEATTQVLIRGNKLCNFVARALLTPCVSRWCRARTCALKASENKRARTR